MVVGCHKLIAINTRSPKCCSLLLAATQAPQPNIEEDDYDAAEDAPASAPSVAAAPPRPAITLVPSSCGVPAMAPADAQV